MSNPCLSFNSIYSSFSVIYTRIFLVFKSRCSFPNRWSPLVPSTHYPKTATRLPVLSAAVLQRCGPLPLARQVPANIVSSLHSCKRIVGESSRSRPTRPGSPSAGRRAAWLPCKQPSAPSAGRSPRSPGQRRLLRGHIHQFNSCWTLHILS